MGVTVALEELLTDYTQLSHDPRRHGTDSDAYDSWLDSIVKVEEEIITQYIGKFELPAFLADRLRASEFTDDDVEMMVESLRKEVAEVATAI